MPSAWFGPQTNQCRQTRPLTGPWEPCDSIRQEHALGFDNFAGHGFFVGPTIYANLSERSWILFAWNVQIAGRSVDDPASLDLKNFERHQATLKFGFTF